MIDVGNWWFVSYRLFLVGQNICRAYLDIYFLFYINFIFTLFDKICSIFCYSNFHYRVGINCKLGVIKIKFVLSIMLEPFNVLIRYENYTDILKISVRSGY